MSSIRIARRVSRFAPMPKSLEDDLSKLQEDSKPNAVYVLDRVNPTTNLRTTLEKIIKRAEVKQWPKLWQNLRASASTDFARALPGHVAAAICGHTKQIAQEHYWTVTDSDLAAASSLFNEIKAQAAVEAVQEPEVKPEAVSVGNGSQGVASDDPKMHKSQGKRDFSWDSMKDQWAKRDQQKFNFC